ncbi:MAG: AAA family ATPase [bacterium]
MSHHIVITGAPASGKTEFLHRLKDHHSFCDFVFFDELARQLLLEDPQYRQDRRRFHSELYRRQVAREEHLGERPFITDRGTADAFAFHRETMHQVGTTLDREYRRYTAVVQFGSTASLGEAYYQCDEIRQETIEQALSIERAIRNIWCGHPGYRWVEARIDPGAKYTDCLKLLTDLVRQPG